MTVAGVCLVAAISGCALTGWRASQQDAALPSASCGSTVTHMLSSATKLLSAGPGALACFDAAARSCRPASLTVTEMGTDDGADDVFVVKPGGGACQVTEFSQSWSANFGGSHSAVTSINCRLVAIAAPGVTLNCGGQQLLIPATVIVLGSDPGAGS